MTVGRGSILQPELPVTVVEESVQEERLRVVVASNNRKFNLVQVFKLFILSSLDRLLVFDFLIYRNPHKFDADTVGA